MGWPVLSVDSRDFKQITTEDATTATVTKGTGESTSVSARGTEMRSCLRNGIDGCFVLVKTHQHGIATRKGPI